MKKTSLTILAVVLSFFLGFAFKTIISRQPAMPAQPKKVTGIGGIFFKCKDPKK